jgi:predicted membrane-bound spermidine synthase
LTCPTPVVYCATVNERGRLPGVFPFGVALASFATIALELLLTRIYSVTMYYHFAFMVISLALLGLAAGGVALYLFPKFFARRSPAFWGALSMLGFAAGVLLALTVALRHPISLRGWSSSWGTLLAIYLAASVPFLCSGLALSVAIASAREQIGRIYAFDLAGAALGCLFVVPVVSWLGAPGALVLVAATGAAAALLFAVVLGRDGRWVTWASAAVAAALLVVAVQERTNHRFGAARNPDKFLGNRPVLFERWNAFSQITVATAGEPDHRWIFIDADAATRMWSGDIRKDNYRAPRRIPEVRVASLVYALRHDGTALIIGPGGGTDVISALSHGVPRVVGVEVNPIIVDQVMRSTYADWNGDLYRDPRVHIVVDEGRSYIRRAPEAFASIQATLVDTWAASSSGAFTLSENNIYTREAFSEFLDHLAPGGILTVTRWYDAGSPKEFLRLVALGRAALEARGVPGTDIARHVAIATDNNRRGTLLLSRDPYRPDDLARLRTAASDGGLRLLFTPGGRAAGHGGDEDGLLHTFLDAPDADVVLAAQRYDARATTDDRPFFFYSLRGRDLLTMFGRLDRMEINNLGIAILFFLLMLSVVMTLLLVVGPLLLLRREALRQARSRKLRLLGYFLCLGLGYILVEIGFMQKFVLFLGHPIYALAVVLATLLAASGAGSALSGWGAARFGLRGFAMRVVLVLTALLGVYAAALTPIFHGLLGLPLPVRIGVAVVLIAPVGVLMGAMLPTGVRAANSLGQDMVAWAWGANGAASVVGSVAAMFLSMNFGFTIALGVGIAIYLAAMTLLPEPPTASVAPVGASTAS